MPYKFIIKMGGEGSGNFGHEGRQGQVGGSGEGGGGEGSKELDNKSKWKKISNFEPKGGGSKEGYQYGDYTIIRAEDDSGGKKNSWNILYKDEIHDRINGLENAKKVVEQYPDSNDIKKHATVSSVHVPSALPNLSIRGTGPKKKNKMLYKFTIKKNAWFGDPEGHADAARGTGDGDSENNNKSPGPGEVRESLKEGPIIKQKGVKALKLTGDPKKDKKILEDWIKRLENKPKDWGKNF